MAKSRKPSRPKKQRQKAAENRPRITLLSLALGLATLLGYATIVPRPVISLGDPVDPDNPFSSRFTFTNQGFIPLTDVFIGIHPQYVKKGNAEAVAPPRKTGDAGAVFTVTTPEWEHLSFGMDDTFTISISQVIGPFGGIDFAGPGEWKSGDLSVIVRYNPFYIPYRKTREFHVQMHKETNGKFYWNLVPSPN